MNEQNKLAGIELEDGTVYCFDCMPEEEDLKQYEEEDGTSGYSLLSVAEVKDADGFYTCNICGIDLRDVPEIDFARRKRIFSTVPNRK